MKLKMGILAGTPMWGQSATNAARTQVVENLNAGLLDGIVMTDRVGSCGHNLVGASNMIFLGSLYSQAMENQAIGIPYSKQELIPWSNLPGRTGQGSKGVHRAGIRSVRTGSRPWTDTDTEVDWSRTEPRFLTSVRSFKAVRTDVIGTEEQSEPTDVESVFLHVRTEPIGKIVAFTEPNRY